MIKKPRIVLGICVLTLAVAKGMGAESPQPKTQLAEAPPLGWNSFDSYLVYLPEQAALQNIEAMAAKLKPHGYQYFVIDNGWFGEYKLREGTLYPAEKQASDIRLNQYGQFLPSRVYFPNGFKPLVDRCHELGLKFGLHLMRGIPRKAYQLNLPIEGTSFTARDIANTNRADNCPWCTYCYAVDMSKPGAQQWYDGLIQHIANLGVEMIKYDDIVPHPDEVAAVVKAIAKTGKPILLSLSPGNTVDPDALDIFRQANMLRVTHDIWDNQKSIDSTFAAWRKWQGKERPGFWIDMDMIPFGRLCLTAPTNGVSGNDGRSNANIALAGDGKERWSRFTRPQMRTFITQRALAASPLFIGGDLPTLDDYSLHLITDPDMLACNQNGVMGRLILDQDGFETWKVEKQGRKSNGWIGVFNRTDQKVKFSLTSERIGIAEAGIQLRDVWRDSPMHFNQTVKLEPHDVLFLKFGP